MPEQQDVSIRLPQQAARWSMRAHRAARRQLRAETQPHRAPDWRIASTINTMIYEPFILAMILDASAVLYQTLLCVATSRAMRAGDGPFISGRQQLLAYR